MDNGVKFTCSVNGDAPEGEVHRPQRGSEEEATVNGWPARRWLGRSDPQARNREGRKRALSGVTEHDSGLNLPSRRARKNRRGRSAQPEAGAVQTCTRSLSIARARTRTPRRRRERMATRSERLVPSSNPEAGIGGPRVCVSRADYRDRLRVVERANDYGGPESQRLWWAASSRM
jgi:hypothetical protein